MFCKNCGTQLPDDASFCTNCGAKMIPPTGGAGFTPPPVGGTQGYGNQQGYDARDFSNAARQQFQNAERGLSSAIGDMRDAFNGQYSGPGRALKTDRNLLTYILLTLVTCGFYGFFFIYSIARDVNVACEGDNEETGGLVAYILLSYVTCGIYSLIWMYKLGNRLANNAPRYGMTFQENGTSVLLWTLIGSILCGIGSFVAMHIIIKNTNAICAAYNHAHGM